MGANEFIFDGLPGQTRAMPGGVPPITTPKKPNVIEWTTGDVYEAGETYSFKTMVTIPAEPVRSSTNKFFFEWGVNETSVSLSKNASLFGRSAAARADSQQVRSLRGFKVELATSLEGEKGTMWFWFETITPVLANGSIDILLPDKFHD